MEGLEALGETTKLRFIHYTALIYIPGQNYTR